MNGPRGVCRGEAYLVLFILGWLAVLAAAMLIHEAYVYLAGVL